MSRFLALALLATTCIGSLTAADAKPADAAAAKPYPLTTCIVSGEALDSMGGAIVKVYDGQEVKFCCRGCIKKFEKSKPDYMKKMDAPVATPATPATPAAPVPAAP